MKLHTITITASADAEPEKSLVFVWRYGDPLEDLEQAAVLIREYVAGLREPASKAASANSPLPPPL